MIERVARGTFPRKHHIALRGDDGALRWEECLTRKGFDGLYTIAYHEHRPHEHRVASVEHGFTLPVAAPPQGMAKRHYRSLDVPVRAGAQVDVRVPLLFNEDVVVGIARPDQADPVYYANADADEVLFIFQGGGVLRTMLGDLRFEQDDYVVIPKGLFYRTLPDAGPQTWLTVEALGGVHIPTQWRNEAGQLRMDAPYSHRDFRAPTFVGPLDEGIRQLLVKRGHTFSAFTLQHSPLDVVGWDGAVYPFVFPILNFQPRAGLVHLPPDWHGTFAARGALLCSFVPRVVDFHPEAIPCPYPHSSVDCDEVLFYCRGNFTSRRGVGPGSISYHPAGIPHGPHPGAYEASLGAQRTDELAVMMDTLRPLIPTAAALAVEDPGYQDSFIS
ncbi:homogentisate 1,2-dioxygenase [Chondromyces apiculatus]|uniref:Homogentisate 1,2-dioxygenase n=1 Tax=Chondromyces apiculatus DSM 436 TaxID=1192034 RepID=A0A017T5A1_9BACT|nr:homogentisate 1,2-dioxygenase [Chondromyces apiculatus]EYF04167.1 Homogentisate 1,2-dioxygenase [Chondromyces apiculatus DSM 436]